MTTASTHSLKSGNTKSCGCLKSEKAARIGRSVLTTHSLSKIDGKKTRLFRIWTGMKTRCYNINDKAYPRYGGRGIVICNDWLSFETFHNWAVNNGYEERLSIDRVNVYGNYEPSNCKWSTAKEQASNKTNTKIYSIDGKSYTLKQLSDEFAVSSQTILKRLQSGKSLRAAISNTNYRFKNSKQFINN